MKKSVVFELCAILGVCTTCFAASEPSAGATAETNDIVTIVVEGRKISKYREDSVEGATFTSMKPEELPVSVDVLTSDYIREQNPTDLHDLMRYVPGIETGGKSLLVRNPGTFSIRGKGGTEPAFEGMFPIGRGAGLFIDPFMMERVEIVKGPIASLSGGAGSVQNASGGGGSVNLYLKSANLKKDEMSFAENTSVGKHIFRQRGMFDVNEIVEDDKFAVRLLGTADYYEPTYIHEGSQKGARPRESFTLAPSLIYKLNSDVTMGVKTMFQYTDQPSYIGVPVWRGRPGGGYGWYESSCRRGDRSHYEGFLINPYLDWQVTDDWLLKFGGALSVLSWEQTTREPYAGKGDELLNYYQTGTWYSGNKYMTSTFSESSSLSRNYNFYTRSIWSKEYFENLENTLVVQPDYYYRESTGGFGIPTSRYGLLAQDTVSLGMFSLLGGVRYDYFDMSSQGTQQGETAHAVSPRGGLSVRPLDWLVLFGNLSQTRTPMLGVMGADGKSLTKPWYCTQYEGGLRVSPADKLWLSLSAYRIEQENTPIAISNTGYYEQEGRSVSRGAELSLTGDITDNWSVMTMYAFNQYTDRSVAPGSKGRDFERYPAHSVSLSTSYRFDSGVLEDLVVGCSYRFKSMSYACVRGSYQHENLRFDPSHVFDINMSLPLSKFGGSENWILSFGIRNLFGEKYFESARHYYECLVGEPRTFEIGMRAVF